MLNTDLSDSGNPRGSGSDSSGQDDSPRGAGRRGGFGGGFGGGRGGFGGSGGYGGGGGGRYGGRSQQSPEDRQKMQELMNDVRRPSATLTISHNDPSLAITDAQDHTRVFQTTGKKDKHQFESGTVDSTTRWDGNKLVTEYDLGNGRKVRYTYSLVPATKQLVEQITMDGGPGGNARNGRGAPTIKLVYDSAKAKAQ